MERDDREDPPSPGVVVDTSATDLARGYLERRDVVVSVPKLERAIPLSPPFGDRKLELLIIDDPRRGEYSPSSYGIDPAVFGEPLMPTMTLRTERTPRFWGSPDRRRPRGWPLPARSSDTAITYSGEVGHLTGTTWIESPIAKRPSVRVIAARERGRRLAELWRAKRAARRARRVAGITAMLHQLAEHDARRGNPDPHWQERVLAAIDSQETR